ncbi:GNAT family N-acetyltransferase [Rhizocola hellebori]|nr:GNAT family N-acetyltransferase [Rhizocola hellebori]
MAIDEADPDETMPPMVGAPGWTPMRQAAFIGFFEPMLAGLQGPKRTVLYGIKVDGLMAGFIRMSLTDRPGVVETGMWMGRTWRGLGAGKAALTELLHEAARNRIHTVVADTTPENKAAIGVLRKLGATIRESDKIYAEISIGPAYAGDLDK